MLGHPVLSVYEKTNQRKSGTAFPIHFFHLNFGVKGSSQSQVGGVAVIFSILNCLKSKKLFEKSTT